MNLIEQNPKVKHITLNPWTIAAIKWISRPYGVELLVQVSWNDKPGVENCRVSTDADRWLILVNGEVEGAILDGYCMLTLMPEPEDMVLSFEGRHILALN